jgi:hypothetical protein
MDPFDFLLLAQNVFEIVKQEYSSKSDALTYTDDEGVDRTVARPNHGLCHCMRVGLLAGDIVRVVLNSRFDRPASVEFFSELKMIFDSDKMFLARVQIAAAFQRTGRDSKRFFLGCVFYFDFF